LIFEGAYLIVAASAFLAATLLPFYSEIVLVSLLIEGKDPMLLWIAATLGNTLGAAVNWLLGRFLLHYQDRSWFPVKRQQLVRAQAWFQRYGVWSLLFAWLPVGGDALTFIAGIMRVRFGLFFLLTAAGKGARYGVIIWLTGAFSEVYALGLQ
jgi:membrane protein YqaA with SNARE-associated domain